MKRCTKCILPDTMPYINFDSSGVCNYCSDYEPFCKRNGDSLKELFNKYSGEDYDCILGLSGGRDSSYALYALTQIYGKRVLAVHYKSPFSHEQGTKNAIKMAEAFSTKLIIITDKNDLHRRCFSNNIKAFFKKPNIAMVSMMCIACKTKWIEIFKIAKKHKIGLVIAASNPFENTSFKDAFLGIKPGSKNIYIRRFIAGGKELIKNPRYINKDTLLTTFCAFIYLDSFSPFLKFLYPKQKKIDIFYHIDWDEKNVINTITKFGWEKPANENSTWRFDCVVGKIKDFIYYSNYGFTEKDDLYSKLIRENKLSRETALRRINTENVLDIEGTNNCLSVCDIKMSDLTN